MGFWNASLFPPWRLLKSSMEGSEYIFQKLMVWTISTKAQMDALQVPYRLVFNIISFKFIKIPWTDFSIPTIVEFSCNTFSDFVRVKPIHLGSFPSMESWEWACYPRQSPVILSITIQEMQHYWAVLMVSLTHQNGLTLMVSLTHHEYDSFKWHELYNQFLGLSTHWIQIPYFCWNREISFHPIKIYNPYKISTFFVFIQIK